MMVAVVMLAAGYQLAASPATYREADDLQLTFDDRDVGGFAVAHSLIDEADVVVNAFASHMLSLSCSDWVQRNRTFVSNGR
jgi:hypothetical protein